MYGYVGSPPGWHDAVAYRSCLRLGYVSSSLRSICYLWSSLTVRITLQGFVFFLFLSSFFNLSFLSLTFFPSCNVSSVLMACVCCACRTRWRTAFIIKWKNVSREIEDFVETHLCKLRGILRSRVLRVLCDLTKDVSPVELTECTYMAMHCLHHWLSTPFRLLQQYHVV